MGIFTPLLDLLFPPRCVLCDERIAAETEVFGTCSDCLGKIPHPESCCRRCAHPMPDHVEYCPECLSHTYSFTEACAVSEYKGVLKATIHKYKYKGRKDMASTLGTLMARQVGRCSWPELNAVIPVPLHDDKRRERGYDQALLLAQVVADELHLPVRKLLLRDKNTLSQTKLDAKERWLNVANAFSMSKKLEIPSQVLLVDDLLTTGATAHFAGQTLLAAGVKDVYLTVIAR